MCLGETDIYMLEMFDCILYAHTAANLVGIMYTRATQFIIPTCKCF